MLIPKARQATLLKLMRWQPCKSRQDWLMGKLPDGTRVSWQIKCTQVSCQLFTLFIFLCKPPYIDTSASFCLALTCSGWITAQSNPVLLPSKDHIQIMQLCCGFVILTVWRKNMQESEMKRKHYNRKCKFPQKAIILQEIMMNNIFNLYVLNSRMLTVYFESSY